jgi:hypothetical protein
VIRLRKAEWIEFRNPGFPGAWYGWGDTKVCVAKEYGLWHISISCPTRYPTWDEIYTAWYDLVPDAANINGAIILPRKAEYVNAHPNCFHVYQLRDEEIPGSIIL